MTSNLHPIFQQALAPWTPPTEPAPVPSMADQLQDEYRSGLDSVPPGRDWEDEE